MKTITKDKANKLLQKGAILVDMRSPVAYRDGHIAESVNLPLKNFTNLLMKTDRKKTIIIYGDTANDVDMSVGYNYAETLGFSEVYSTDYNTLK